MNLLDSFQRYIDENDLATHDDKILLTVSGGVDSMVMLRCSPAAATGWAWPTATSSCAAQRATRTKCWWKTRPKKHGAAFYNRRFETRAEMERTGESMEMAARRLRYRWFDALSREHGSRPWPSPTMPTTRSRPFSSTCCAEPGCGADGNLDTGRKMIRPLMFASRKEDPRIRRPEPHPFREDSSNRSTKYLRNKIRLGLIPRIREINPKFTSLMSRNLARLTDAQLFINHGIERIRGEAVTSADGVRHDPTSTASTRHSRREFVIYELLSSAYGFKGDVIDSLCHSLGTRGTGRGSTLARTGGLHRPRHHRRGADRPRRRLHDAGGKGPCGATAAIRCSTSNTDIDTIKNFGRTGAYRAGRCRPLQFPLTLRRWQEGDWFVPFRHDGPQESERFSIDAKVSDGRKTAAVRAAVGRREIGVASSAAASTTATA